MSLNISADISKESLHALSKYKPQEGSQGQAGASTQAEAQSQLTGLVWSQQTVQKTPDGGKSGEVTQTKPEIAAPSVDDLAVLTSSVSMHDEAVKAPDNYRLAQSMRIILNPAALEESFKETFKKSKSHNLLLERFMSNVKLGSLNILMSLCGVEAEKLDEIKAQVREEALKEIDIKIRQDWAYTKAMLDITGG